MSILILGLRKLLHAEYPAVTVSANFFQITAEEIGRFSMRRCHCHSSIHYFVHCVGDVIMPCIMYPGVKPVVWRSDIIPQVGLDESLGHRNNFVADAKGLKKQINKSHPFYSNLHKADESWYGSHQPLQENEFGEGFWSTFIFQQQMAVGSLAHFKLMTLILNSWMKTNMVARAWHKDRSVDLGTADDFVFGALRLKD
jgi:hypothetical protein